MKKTVRPFLVYMLLALLAACSTGSDEEQEKQKKTGFVEDLKEYPISQLPEGLIWETNNDDPVFSSPDAKKGGTFRSYQYSFPLTLRSVGPDANNLFANYIHAFEMGLINIHPDTFRPIPELATHWAFAEDGKTVYYRLDPNARWSDGHPVTADDFMFTREFMLSEHIFDPFYNNYFTEQIKDVKKYDEYTVSVTYAIARPKTDLLYYTNIRPKPRHFHKLDKNWVRDYNWRIEPNTGPYQISELRKGKFIEYSRHKEWWARDYRYFKNRYNVDKIRITIIRELETAFNHFLKGELDTFWMVWPNFWHDKATGPEYDAGYIHKIQFYYDAPQPMQGYHLNTEIELFKDKNVRYGFAHSLNIQKIIDTLIRGDYQRQHAVFNGYGDYTNKDIRAREYDLDLAEEYFAKAGWSERGPDGIRVKDGKRLSVSIPYGQNNLTERFVLLREEAKKAGVEINLQLMDSSSAFKKISDKKHQVAYVALTPEFRPSYWQLFHSDNAHRPNTNNFSNCDDPELDGLIDAYRFGTDERERQRLSREIAARIHELGVYIPDYSVPFTRASYWRWIQLPRHHGTKSSDYLFPPRDLGLFWIDEDVKQETLRAMKQGRTFAPVTIIDETYKVN